MTEIETFEVRGNGITVAAIVWQRYRRRTPGLVEQVLGLNPGLADHGPFIPNGTKIVIPLLQPPVARVMPLVKLWS